ncbi:cytochrome P450 3A17 [Lophiostoma macrostomum CBS 122681]|uniref:Cytochrome P450 3A17 n=1 Tax=Lophiostoma macrostomum CBS 122681 TaxID=1314788 RepID=A0A6A6T0A2_9PLEO|nr:cytochrome P450 3A17 [Lophiostoma macrostomum CBS 122681]
MEVLRSVPVLLGVVSLFTLLYGLLLVVYRLYFHPLKSYPGPKHLAAFGSFHSYKNQIAGTWHKYMLEVHEKYGPIVRIGPDHLAVDGSIGWPDIYDHKRANRPEFGRIVKWFNPSGKGMHNIFTADRENHRRQRRLMAHAFSQSAMYEQESLIKMYVDLLITRLQEHSTAHKPVDAVRWFNFATFDIIGDLAFADSFDCLGSSNMHPWVSMIFDNVRAGSILRFCFDNPLLAIPMRSFYGKRMLEAQEQHRALASEKTKRRLALGPAPDGRKDFLTYMLRHNDEKGMTETEIIHNTEPLIVAGSETTATALSGLTYYLTQNPVVMKRLTNEIRSAFTEESEITMKATTPLQYLNVCIEEAMRCYPPVPESPPRQSPGDYIRGKYIPEGTKITIYQWATYHSAQNFVEPFAFRPERWLAPTNEWYDHAFDHDNKAAFSPFSAGPRNCIGKNLAYSELRLIMARFLWNFDVDLVEGYEGWPEKQKAFILWDKPPMMVHLTRVVRGQDRVLSEKHQ